MNKSWLFLFMMIGLCAYDSASASDAKQKWDSEATEAEKASLMESLANLSKDTNNLKANDSTLSVWGDKAIRFCGYKPASGDTAATIAKPDKKCYAAVVDAYDAYRGQQAQITGSEPIVPIFLGGAGAPKVPASPGRSWVSAEPSREAVAKNLGPKPKSWKSAEPSRNAVVQRLGPKPRPKT